MSDFPNVQILMATYNGEKFLVQQLESIFAQTYPHWELLVRDDGSKDMTVDVLKAYQTRYPNHIHIVQDGGGNLGGPSQNFERLAQLSTAPIIGFSDQDDIWLLQKLERSVDAIKDIHQRKGIEKPVLVHHDCTLIDQDNNLLEQSFDRKLGYRKSAENPRIMPYDANVHGFTMTANRAAIDLALPFPKIVLGHDTVIPCLAHDAGGTVEFIPEQLAHYRRHGSNASAIQSFARRALTKLFSASTHGELTSCLKSAFVEAHKNLDRRCQATQSYIDAYPEHISPERIAELGKLAHLDELGVIDRKLTIRKHTGASVRSGILAALVL